MAYSSVRNGVGSSSNRFRMSLANKNYSTQYFQNVHASGDIRAYYLHQRYKGAGSGEVIRAVAEAYTTGCAAGGTINAAHFTGRVGAAMTVSGALSGVRATIEVAGTTPTPGGTLAALHVDSNIVTGWTAGANDAFIRVSNSGAGLIGNLFYISDAIAVKSDTAVATTLHGDHAATHGIKIRVGTTSMWLLAATDAPSA
jgi:hypothetical protein